jgi:hypothetical protein
LGTMSISRSPHSEAPSGSMWKGNWHQGM